MWEVDLLLPGSAAELVSFDQNMVRTRLAAQQVHDTPGINQYPSSDSGNAIAYRL
jgi:hypothetical protein